VGGQGYLSCAISWKEGAFLQAACYGRAFCPADAFPRKRIVQVCRLLILANALGGPVVPPPPPSAFFPLVICISSIKNDTT